MTDRLDFDAAPLPMHRVSVRPEWLDYSGHVRAGQYVILFEKATEHFLARAGLAGAGELGAAPFLLEMHTCYLRELRLGDEAQISVQALGAGDKSLHLIMFMHTEADELVATTELAIVNVSLDTRRAQSWTPEQRHTLTALVSAHAALPVPAQAGRAIRMTRA